MGADLEQIRWWSWRRQRLDRASRGIDDCLRSIIGVPSANPMGSLSLLARVPRLMQGMVDGAISSKIAVRLPAMRGTVWMLHAETAHMAMRATFAPPGLRAMLKREGLTEEDYERLERDVLLAAGRPMLPDEIKEAINDPPAKLNPILNAMTAAGKLMRIKAKSPLSNAFTYAATRVWLGHELPEVDPAEALVWLAGDYLKGYGPASAEDFAAWAGVEPERAAAAMAAHDPADLGDGLLMWQSEVHAFEGTRSVANRVNLLPALDPYTMGYAESSRARFADPEVMPFLYDKGGNSTSVILIDGTVAGLWDFTLSDKKIEIRIGLFEDPTPRALEGIEAEAGLVAGFFQAREVAIRRVKIKSPISERAQGSHLKPLAGQETKPSKPKAVAAPTRKAKSTATTSSKSSPAGRLASKPSSSKGSGATA